MNLEELKKARKTAKGSITRIETFLERNKDVTLNMYEYVSRQEVLKQAFERFSEAQDQIEEFDDSIEQTLSRDETEDKYFKCLSVLKQIIDRNSLNVSNVQVQHERLTNSRMPEIVIDKFTGLQQNWSSFYNIFKAMVLQRTDMPDVQKLIYLKGFLQGEPLKLVESLGLIDSNLKVAMDILEKRYANKLATIYSHIKGLVEIPSIQKGNTAKLREFIVCIKQHTDSLKNLQVPIKEWDLLLVYILSQRLDYNTRRSYELERGPDQLPTLDSFLTFVEKGCQAAENLASPEFHGKNTYFKPVSSVHARTGNNAFKSKGICLYCKEFGHSIHKCAQFIQLTVMQRRQFVFDKRLCYKCFSPHSANTCSSKGCPLCGLSHNSLLHTDKRDTRSKQFAEHKTDVSRFNGVQAQADTYKTSSNKFDSSDTFQDNNQKVNLECHNQQGSDVLSCHTSGVRDSKTMSTLSDASVKNVLLATATVNVVASNGRIVQAKAILDSGSQISLVTEKLSKMLNCLPVTQSVHISGISGNKSICNQMVSVEFNSRIDSQRRFRVSCSILKKITSKLPQFTVDTLRLRVPTNIELADPTFYKPSDIDLLIGADLYYDVLVPGIIKLGDGIPVLQNTHLGWVIAGPVLQNYVGFLNSQSLEVLTGSVETEDLIEKFWTLEEVPKEQSLSYEDELAEQIFKESTKILENGRFQVDVPLKRPNEHLKLGESFSLAGKRFLLLERRLHKNRELFDQYKEFIDEYVRMGHARYVTPALKNECGENKYFIPHHCVIREDKITTRLRVVFDASMKTKSGYSLNDVTLKGFQVQPNLFDILIRFRCFQYTLVADIQKMFRQILINPDQRYLQNILWRDNPTEAIKCIELSTVSYGTNFAPYVATRCLAELSNIHRSRFPHAAAMLEKQCYVDDILGGCNDLQVLTNLHKELVELLASGGFILHKFCSNSTKFLMKINESRVDETYEIRDRDHSNKVLGVIWNSGLDHFSISPPNYLKTQEVTKRSVLSIISQIYDPIGFVAPVVVVAKIFMQKIWLSKVGWDEVLNDELQLEWQRFLDNIAKLSELVIPRLLIANKSLQRVELHGFSDASLQAYGGCLYMRVLYADKTVSCRLVCSKSRISPLKTISLPKLELCACLLLANLTEKVVKVFKGYVDFDSVNLWTDSQIALCWIFSHPSRWNIFVSNRVAQIQELTSKCNWRHISSAENPADHVSRGLSSRELTACVQWWSGPKCLHNFDTNLKDFNFVSKLEGVPEQKRTVMVTVKDDYWSVFMEKFSCFTKLQRTLAYVLRVCHNLKSGSEKHFGVLKVQELENSVMVIVKLLQRKYMSWVVKSLEERKPLTDKAVLSLSPFLDSSGIIRVGGRLLNANVPYSQKYPILLPANNHVVNLMLRMEHLRLYHAGAQTVLSNFRLRYWPLNGLRCAKRIIRNCVTCHKFKAQIAKQVMADLPKDRVTISRPFVKTALDYGGPFEIRSSRLRRAPLIKAYIAIFVCMVTKCVHIELVTSLSTEAFFLTLRRFIARRGNPSVIYSDNAANFLGARNQLKELYEFFKNKSNCAEIETFLTKNEIQWKFIPPQSPHWGGIWEAAIKSAKHHLYRVVGNTHLTFEELSTVLATIESILNSRPLVPLSSDPSELSCLTPGHFLIGNSLAAYPEKNLTDVSDNRLSIWQKCTKIQQIFWKRWVTEYLNRLQNKPKWLNTSENLKVDQVVLLKNDNTLPLKWPLARIIEILPSFDGKVRVVKVKSKDGIFTRSLAKICPLPAE